MSITLAIIVIFIVLILALLIARRQRRKARLKGVAGEAGAENRQIYVGNLPYQVTEQNLKDFFSKYGNIQQVRIIRNYSSGRSKGFGFVTYGSLEDTKKALASHGEQYQGRTIIVRIAKPR